MPRLLTPRRLYFPVCNPNRILHYLLFLHPRNWGTFSTCSRRGFRWRLLRLCRTDLCALTTDKGIHSRKRQGIKMEESTTSRHTIHMWRETWGEATAKGRQWLGNIRRRLGSQACCYAADSFECSFSSNFPGLPLNELANLCRREFVRYQSGLQSFHSRFRWNKVCV